MVLMNIQSSKYNKNRLTLKNLMQNVRILPTSVYAIVNSIEEGA